MAKGKISNYIFNVWKSISFVFYAIILGRKFPTPQIERGDKYYYGPTYDEFYEALLITHAMMVEGGWTVENYQKRSKDCEDYAAKMSVEIRNYIATTFEVGEKGVAVGRVSYIRDVDGVAHAILQVHLSDNSIRYYEPYPLAKYLDQKDLSKQEIGSIYSSIM